MIHARSLWSGVMLLQLAGMSCERSTGPKTTVRERWYKVQAGYGPTRPAISGDKVIFAAGGNLVIARDRSTGAERWATQVTSVAQTSGFGGVSMVVRQGVVIVPVLRNTVGLDVVDGRELWSYEAPLDTIDDPQPIPGSVEVARVDADSSTVFIPASGASVSAVDVRTGSVKWVWRVDGTLPFRSGSTGVRVSGDTVFATVWHFLDRQGLNAEGWLIALDRVTGRELWKVVLPVNAPGVAIAGAPALYRNLAIVTLMGGHEVAIERTTRAVVWQFIPKTQTATITSPEVYGDLVFHDGGDLSVYALKAADGTLVWKSFFTMVNNDLLVTDRRVYGSNGGVIVIFDRLTGRRIANINQPHSSDDLIASPAAYANGQVFVTVNGAAWSFQEP